MSFVVIVCCYCYDTCQSYIACCIPRHASSQSASLLMSSAQSLPRPDLSTCRWEFLNLSTIGIWGQIILWCQKFGSILRLFLLDTSKMLLQLWQSKISPDIARCLLGDKIAPVETHLFRPFPPPVKAALWLLCLLGRALVTCSLLPELVFEYPCHVLHAPCHHTFGAIGTLLLFLPRSS